MSSTWSPGSVCDLGRGLRELSSTPFKSKFPCLQKRDDDTRLKGCWRIRPVKLPSGASCREVGPWQPSLPSATPPPSQSKRGWVVHPEGTWPPSQRAWPPACPAPLPDGRHHPLCLVKGQGEGIPKQTDTWRRPSSLPRPQGGAPSPPEQSRAVKVGFSPARSPAGPFGTFSMFSVVTLRSQSLVQTGIFPTRQGAGCPVQPPIGTRCDLGAPGRDDP